LKPPAFFATLWGVELEDALRGFPNGSHRHDQLPNNAKVLTPNISAWIEESRQLPRQGQGSEVTAFVIVAEKAGIGQVVKNGEPTMLLRHDMIDLMGDRRIVFVKQAILTTPSCTFTDLPTKYLGNVGTAHVFMRLVQVLA
jgi:hypothetical protein